MSRAKTLAANSFSKTSQGGQKHGTDVNAPTAQPKLLVLDQDEWKSIFDALQKATDQALNQNGQKTLGQGFTKFCPISISLERAYHLSTGCGEFVNRFSQGYMTISTPGHLHCAGFRSQLVMEWNDYVHTPDIELTGEAVLAMATTMVQD